MRGSAVVGKDHIFLIALIIINATFILAINNCSYTSTTSKGISWCREPKKFYCIQIGSMDFMETCLKPHAIPSGQEGCPWLSLEGDVSRIGQPFTKCNATLQGCPPLDHPRYTTDELLAKYPLCLLPAKSREKVTFRSFYGHIERIKYNTTDATKNDLKGGNTKSQTPNKTSNGWMIAFVIVLFLMVAAASTLFVCFMKGFCRCQFLSYSRVPLDEETRVTFNATSKKEEKRDVYIAKYQLNGGATLKTDEFLESAPTKLIKDAMKTGRIAWLWGLSGSGKTHTAKWYVMHMQDKCNRNIDPMTPKAWIIECRDVNRMFATTKRVVDRLGIPFKGKVQSPEDDIEDLVHPLPDSIRRDKGYEHIFIFDQVDQENMSLVEKLITILEACQSIRCIVTSENEPLGTFHHKKVQVKGFNEADSVLFLKGFGDENELIDFANSMDHSPYALKIAKEFMKSSRIKVHSFWDCISLDGEAKPGNPLEKCLAPFRMHVEHLQENEMEVFNLLRYVQFLKSKEIPVYIFTFLLSKKNFKEANLLTNLFVQSMQTSALGFFEGAGDRRMLETHDFLKMIFKMYYSDNKVNRLAVFELLKCFSWLFSKYQGNAVDHQRIIEILPHAEELLTEIEKGEYLKDPDLLLSLAYIMTCTHMSYSYRDLGYVSKRQKLSKDILDLFNSVLLSGKYCKEAKMHSTDFGHFDKKPAEEAARDIAAILEEILQNNLREIGEYATDYIVNKHKVVHHIEFLKKVLGRPKLARRVQLSKDELKILQEKKVALGDKQMNTLTRIFLYEVVVAAFLQYGIRATEKYLKGDENMKNRKPEDSNLSHFIETAYQLSIILRQKCALDGINPHCALYTDLNGKMELLLEHVDEKDIANKQSTLDDLKGAESRLRDYLRKENVTSYCETGLIIVKSDDLEVQLSCYRQLLRVYLRLKDHDSSYVDKAKQVADTLNTLLIENKICLSQAISSQKAKQTLADFYIKNEDYQSAKVLLENVIHYNLDEEKHEFPPSQHDVKDVFLLCTCLAALKQPEYCEKISKVKALKSTIPAEWVTAHFELETLDNIGHKAGRHHP